MRGLHFRARGLCGRVVDVAYVVVHRRVQGQVVRGELGGGEEKFARPFRVAGLPRVDAEVEEVAGIRIFRHGVFRLFRLLQRGV